MKTHQDTYCEFSEQGWGGGKESKCVSRKRRKRLSADRAESENVLQVLTGRWRLEEMHPRLQNSREEHSCRSKTLYPAKTTNQVLK